MYRQVDAGAPLTQGDIIDGCPLLTWEKAAGEQPRAGEFTGRIVVLTQACDLAQGKATRIVAALVHDARQLVATGILKSKTIIDQVRLHRVYGWYFLPAGESIDESIVDLRDVHTIPK